MVLLLQNKAPTLAAAAVVGSILAFTHMAAAAAAEVMQVTCRQKKRKPSLACSLADLIHSEQWVVEEVAWEVWVVWEVWVGWEG